MVLSDEGPTHGWTLIFDRLSNEWMDAVKLVFDYFCERTPRSFVETRETSLVWNFKYADVEFGRLQVGIASTVSRRRENGRGV